MPDYRKNKYEDLENILNEKIGCYSDLKKNSGLFMPEDNANYVCYFLSILKIT